jgi:glycosyltransferase involved in cell wall biosynthesis
MGERPSNRACWILVAGGFHGDGGMDRANFELASYLLEIGENIHLVGHRVDERLLISPLVTVQRVSKPINSFFLGESLLRHAAQEAVRKFPLAKVVANGGNFSTTDTNWVHAFHAKWPVFDPGSPLWFRLKSRYEKLSAIYHESKAVKKARIVIVNSERTRSDVITTLEISPARVHTVYLGSDPTWSMVCEPERAAARAKFSIDKDSPVALFVGAMGYDQNKGFDTVLEAWKVLCGDSVWKGSLLVAGAGRSIDKWQAEIERSGLAKSIRLLGFSRDVYDLLAAADILVSPVRYDSYGLNVHEALSRGVPTIVSRTAGVAERYTPELAELVLPDPTDHVDLAHRMLDLFRNIQRFRKLVQPLAHSLLRYTWTDMARKIVDTIMSQQQVAPVSPSSRRDGDPPP